MYIETNVEENLQKRLSVNNHFIFICFRLDFFYRYLHFNSHNILFLSIESKTTVFETTVMENDAVRCYAVACKVARDQ